MDELIHYSHTYKNKLNGLAKILRYYRRDKAVKNEKKKKNEKEQVRCNLKLNNQRD